MVKSLDSEDRCPSVYNPPPKIVVSKLCLSFPICKMCSLCRVLVDLKTFMYAKSSGQSVPGTR